MSYPIHGYDPIDTLWITPNEFFVDPILMVAETIYALSKRDLKRRKQILDEINQYLSLAFNINLVVEEDFVCCRRLIQACTIKSGRLSEAEYYAIGILLIGLILLPPSGIFLLDSPESYLHPMAQEVLLSPIIKRLKNGQVIIATHSPSLLSTRNPNEIYFIDNTELLQEVKKADHESVINMVRTLYGEKVRDSLVSALIEVSSTSFLAYLLECSTSPSIVTRKKGDPQIQQIATWILGYLSKTSGERLTVVDFGAGTGDLLEAIGRSGCVSYLKYVPVERNKENWPHIIENCKRITNLEYETPVQDISGREKCDIIFFVNVIHELDFKSRVKLISKAVDLTYPSGIIIIHEATVLPKGEANFVMWDGEDLKTILANARMAMDINVANTFTRPGGWPLVTICLHPRERLSSSASLLRGSIRSLPKILSNWIEKLSNPTPSEISDNMRSRYKAFLIAQVANLSIWYNKYHHFSKKNRKSGS